MASKFSKPKPSGSILAWHEAQLGLARCCSIRCRSVAGELDVLRRPSARARRAAAGAAACRGSASRIHLPRFTGEVRVGFDVTVRTLACVSTPPRRLVGQRRPGGTRSPVDARDPVVPGQPLVEEREVGVEQVEDAPVLAHRRPRRTARSPRASPRGAPRRTSGTGLGRGWPVLRLRIWSHWSAKFSTNARDFGSRSIRATCASRFVAGPQLALRGEVEQLVVGHAAPEEVREPRGQLEVVDRQPAGAVRPRSVELDPEEELRRDQHRLDGELDAPLEAVAVLAGPGRRDLTSRATSPAVDGPAVGPGGEPLEDLAGDLAAVLRRRAGGR